MASWRRVSAIYRTARFRRMTTILSGAFKTLAVVFTFGTIWLLLH